MGYVVRVETDKARRLRLRANYHRQIAALVEAGAGYPRADCTSDEDDAYMDQVVRQLCKVLREGGLL